MMMSSMRRKDDGGFEARLDFDDVVGGASQ